MNELVDFACCPPASVGSLSQSKDVQLIVHIYDVSGVYPASSNRLKNCCSLISYSWRRLNRWGTGKEAALQTAKWMHLTDSRLTKQ